MMAWLQMIKKTLKAIIPQKLRRLLHIRYCPVWLPWFACETKMAALQRQAVQAMYLERKANGESLILVLETLAWPVVTAIQAFRNAFGRYGSAVKSVSSLSRGRQLAQQLLLANRYHICSYHYYIFHLWKETNFKKASEYAFHPPFEGLLRLVHGNADISICADKLAFARHCDSFSLPTIPIHAVFRSGCAVEWHSDKQELPAEDLFIKPIFLGGGKGIEIWRCTGKKTWTRGGACLDETSLVRYLRDKANAHDLMVMPRISNAHNSPTFGSDALVTLRIITIRTSGPEDIRVFRSAIRVPMQNSETDNLSAGGMAAPVDDQGIIGKAISNQHVAALATHHPETGRPIEGVQVTGFEPILQLCRDAHRTIPQLSTIGWDVAITDSGPVFVEANSTWNPDIAQIPWECPLGETEFPSWALGRLKVVGDRELTRTNASLPPGA